MNSLFKRFVQKPIFIFLAINILIGLFVFRDYGYSWDEPLFYDYADALGYAYSPHEWFSGHFDLNNSFGPSETDHKTRGPAYILLAREPVYLLEAFGLDEASAWHLINFLFFQFGVYFLYRLATRWMKPSAALAASALFAWQPFLWGHAFINPKDPSFLMFFLASVCLGFEMVDSWRDEQKTTKQKYLRADFSGDCFRLYNLHPRDRAIGRIIDRCLCVRSIRAQVQQPSFLISSYTACIAILVMFGTWPYLWDAPLTRFVEVFRLMSDNPTTLPILFARTGLSAGDTAASLYALYAGDDPDRTRLAAVLFWRDHWILETIQRQC